MRRANMKSLKLSEAQARMRAESNHDGNRMALVPRNFSILPSVAHARLPATYDAAKLAISRCARVDECKDWLTKWRRSEVTPSSRTMSRCAKWLNAFRQEPSSGVVNCFAS